MTAKSVVVASLAINWLVLSCLVLSAKGKFQFSMDFNLSNK